MDQWYKWQYLYKVLGKCFIGYQFFVQTINEQGNYKTDLADVSGPFGQTEFVQILTKKFLSINDGVFSWLTIGITATGKVGVWNMHVNVYYRNVENRCADCLAPLSARC